MNGFSDFLGRFVQNQNQNSFAFGTEHSSMYSNENVEPGNLWKGELKSIKYTELLLCIEIELRLPDTIPEGDSLYNARAKYVGAHLNSMLLPIPLVFRKREDQLQILSMQISEIEFRVEVFTDTEISGRYTTVYPQDFGTFCLRKTVV